MPGGNNMKDTEIDRILAKQDEILPSSGFVASVMEAVRREAVAPPPIPFPWKRALPMLVLAALSLTLVVVVAIYAIVQLGRGSLAPPPPAALMPIGQGTIGSAAAWTALALLATFVSVKLSIRLAGGRA